MRYISWISTVAVGFLVVVIALTIALTPPKCEHEEVTRYVFTTEDSTAHSSVSRYCKKCDERLTPNSLFKGELVDKSYLNAIKEHSDSSEIMPGEYYTVTVTVPQGYNYGSYNSSYPWLNCQVENAEFIVRFHVEFREEFRESLKLIEEGEEITFRGRFYDKGCGFTDCELISINRANEE